MDASFTLSDAAAARLSEILHQTPGALRVSVLAGGCNGFQYKFDLDTAAPTAEDHVFIRQGARVLVDPVSLDLLAGAELHYEDRLMGAHFTVRNPNAKSACGCGTSFSLD